MAKALRESLEAKLAALDNAEWDSADSQSEGSAGSDDENGRSLLLLKPEKSEKGRRKANQGPCTAPIGPDGQSSGVIYIGHIPRGFYEEPMKGFFSQFGDVLRIQLARSKKTGRYKGYGFVEFASADVASIVAETMNGYFLFDKQLVCSVLAFDQIHPELFKRTGTSFRVVSWHERRRRAFNAERTPAQVQKKAIKLVRAERMKRAKLAALGIEYDFPGFEAARKEGELAPKGADDGAQTAETVADQEPDVGGARDGMKKRKVDEDACTNGKVLHDGEGVVGSQAGESTDEATASTVPRLSKKAKKTGEKAAAVKKGNGAPKSVDDIPGTKVAPVLRRGSKRGVGNSTAAPVVRNAKETMENSASSEDMGPRDSGAAVASGSATGTAVAPKKGVKKAKKSSKESAAVGGADGNWKDDGEDSASGRSILLLAPNGVAAPDRKMDDTAVAPKKAAKKGIGAATAAGEPGAAVPPRMSKKLKRSGEKSASAENVAPHDSDGAVVATGEAATDMPADPKKGAVKTKKAKKALLESAVNDVDGKKDTGIAVPMVSSKSAKNSSTAVSVVSLRKDKASALDGDAADTTVVPTKPAKKKGSKKSAADTVARGEDTAGAPRVPKTLKTAVKSSGSTENVGARDLDEAGPGKKGATDTAVAAKKGKKKAKKGNKASQEPATVDGDGDGDGADDGKNSASASVVPSKSATENSGADGVAVAGNEDATNTAVAAKKGKKKAKKASQGSTTVDGDGDGDDDGKNSASASVEPSKSEAENSGADGVAVAGNEDAINTAVAAKKGKKKAKKASQGSTTVDGDGDGDDDGRNSASASVEPSKSATANSGADGVAVAGNEDATNMAVAAKKGLKKVKKGLKKAKKASEGSTTVDGGGDGDDDGKNSASASVEPSKSATENSGADGVAVAGNEDEDATNMAVAAKKGKKKAKKAKKASQGSTAVGDVDGDGDGRNSASASVVPSKSATENSSTEGVSENSGDVANTMVKPKGPAKMAGKNAATTVVAGEKDATRAPKLSKKAKITSESSHTVESVASKKAKKAAEKTAAVRAAEEAETTVVPKKGRKKAKVAEEDTGVGKGLPPCSDGAAAGDGDTGETAVAPKVSKKPRGKAKSVKEKKKQDPGGENDADARASEEGEAAIVVKKARKEAKMADKRATVGDVESSRPDGAAPPDEDLQKDTAVAAELLKKTKAEKKSVKKKNARCRDNEAVGPVADGDGAAGDTVLPSSSVGADPLGESKGVAPVPKKKRKKDAGHVSAGGEEVASLDLGGDNTLPPSKVLKSSKGSGKPVSSGSVPGLGSSAAEAEVPVSSREGEGGVLPVSSLPKRGKKGKKGACKAPASDVAPRESCETGDETATVGDEGEKPVKVAKKMKKGKTVSRLEDKGSEAKEVESLIGSKNNPGITSKDGPVKDVARVATNGRKASEEVSKKKRAVEKTAVQGSKKRRDKKKL